MCVGFIKVNLQFQPDFFLSFVSSPLHCPPFTLSPSTTSIALLHLWCWPLPSTCDCLPAVWQQIIVLLMLLQKQHCCTSTSTSFQFVYLYLILFWGKQQLQQRCSFKCFVFMWSLFSSCIRDCTDCGLYTKIRPAIGCNFSTTQSWIFWYNLLCPMSVAGCSLDELRHDSLD